MRNDKFKVLQDNGEECKLSGGWKLRKQWKRRKLRLVLPDLKFELKEQSRVEQSYGDEQRLRSKELMMRPELKKKVLISRMTDKLE